MDMVSDLETIFPFLVIALPILLYSREMVSHKASLKGASQYLDALIIPLLLLFALNIFLIISEW